MICLTVCLVSHSRATLLLVLTSPTSLAAPRRDSFLTTSLPILNHSSFFSVLKDLFRKHGHVTHGHGNIHHNGYGRHGHRVVRRRSDHQRDVDEYGRRQPVQDLCT